MLLAVLVIIGKYTELKRNNVCFFVCLFICLFVLIDQSGYCYFCSVMRSFCVLRDGQGIFFNIHIYIYTYIYIYSGVGGRIFNPLQCSCEAP